MAAIDTNDILEVVVKGRFAFADDIVSVFQAKITDPQGGTNDEALVWVEEWFTDMITPLATSLSDSYTVAEMLVQNLTQDLFVGQICPDFVGLNTAEATSPQICALVMGRTSNPAIQGRKYSGVYCESNTANGTWNAAMITALEGFADVWGDLLTGANSVEGRGQVVTKDAMGVMTGSTDIVGTRIITDTRTQRRRTIGRGS